MKKPSEMGRRKQFSSCDTCRSRKAKCSWPDVTDERQQQQPICLPCIDKDLVCTSLFISNNVHGKGRLLEQARTRYGIREAVSASGAVLRADPGRIRSAVFKLNDNVISANALCALLQSFDSEVREALPSIDYPRLFSTCQNAQFDLHQLDDLDRLLCLAAMGVVTNISLTDHQFGEGSTVITLRNPMSIKRDLEATVVEQADQMGLQRHPSLRSLEILRLLCVLSSGQECKNLSRSDSYRSLEQGLVEHLRVVHGQGLLPDLQLSQYFWSIVLTDSFACAISGRQPSMTEEDIATFSEFVDLSQETVLRVIRNLTVETVCEGFGYIAAGLCRLLRSIYERVTSRRARKRPMLDLEVISQVPDEIDRLILFMVINEKKSRELFAGELPEIVDFLTKLEHFLFTTVVTLCLDELEKAMVHEIANAAPIARIQAMQDASERLHVVFMREMVYSTGWTPQLRAARVLASADGLMSYHSTLRLKRLFKAITLEEGGISGSWTMAQKLAAAKYFMIITRALAVAIPEVGDELPGLEEDLKQLQRKADSMTLNADGHGGYATARIGLLSSSTVPGLSDPPPLIFGNSLNNVRLPKGIFGGSLH